MLKKVSNIFFLILFTFNLNARQQTIKKDSLLNIIQLKNEHSRIAYLVYYLDSHFRSLPLKRLDSAEINTQKILSKYSVKNILTYHYLIESICKERLFQEKESGKLLLLAINYARKNEDHYLLTILLNNLAAQQTEKGYSIEAISSYRLAKKDAEKIKDFYTQIVIDINISDVYYKNNYYLQALSYLSESESIIYTYKSDKDVKAIAPKLEAIINFNKAEIFFRENNRDSLNSYCEKLQKTEVRYYKLFTFQKRTLSYLYLLNQEYAKTITLLDSMRKNRAYKFDNRDVIDLADAYFKNNQPDSAMVYIHKLLKDPANANRPDLKLHLYDVLGQIAENKNNPVEAELSFKTALQQAKEYSNKLTQIGNVSSLIKIDEIENANNQKDEEFEMQRRWLLLLVVLAILTIVIIWVVYRNVKQKRHYENLLYNKTKTELAFINSHDVRKHLTNILGLIDVMKHSTEKAKTYQEIEGFLFDSSEYLDEAIKHIAAKLNE